ncbi:MAG: 30S ribosomal protein S3 [Candidatus Midichloria sp.]|nr:30S ribosomal protein S3 [Candidatus Midichloria sp.]
MGQKVNPISLRLGIDGLNNWSSIWYANKDYADKLHQDLRIRKCVQASLSSAGISKIKIERLAKKVKVTINAARPGIIIGSKGKDINKVKQAIEAITRNTKGGITESEVIVNVVEVKKPDLDATIVAQNLAQQLEKRIAFRKAAKRLIQNAMRMGAEGIKIKISGRIGGAEIARDQQYNEGRVPLHTLRMMIDYGTAEAHTTYGRIGVKVWVCKGQKSSVNIE